MEQPSRSLWSERYFLKLWLVQSVSFFGTHITTLALPLVAVITLEATPRQMGTLGFIQYIPWLLIAILAGLYADRLPRRPLMIAADLSRAICLALIPIGALGELIGIWPTLASPASGLS
jgi:MFS family permease